MSDIKLLKEVAILWVELGGDAEGVTYCWRDLRDAVDELLNPKKEEE